MSSEIQQEKMEGNSHIMLQGKLGFFGLLKESLSIPFKNPNFIIFTCLASVPLFCSLSIYETIFQQTLIEIGRAVQKTMSPSLNAYDIFNNDYEELITLERWIGKISQKLLLLGLIYIGILHLVDLLNTIAIVDMTSVIYKEEKAMSLRCMFSRFFNDTRLKGPLITSIYVLLFSCLISFGLFSLASYIYIYMESSVFFMVLFLVIFLALLTKYIEWSAIWDMGVVISILEEKQGDVAIIVSSYLSRGWERKGEGTNAMGTTVHIGLVCLLNVLKWVIFVVYFYDCKKQSSQKQSSQKQIATEENIC
ncbi:uncharacterized protein LOC8280542 isoform X1 [Ricinus communis]|uniref:uncharacterized protein LOC8280542 isoform X1 n=1 Tax=Ricinus communis TaxID=3988 RepID=UPI0007729DE7|nr:uncharacterized protein LOC8280542 isoform X1 [Ricinus communis]|eukprot:XP_015573653.1 uncharacterized protein LOC8280542 isoform X1 [Ricinus communis]